MGLSITIHDPKPAYPANSTISGTVHFTSKSDLVVDRIWITLTGRSRSTFVIKRNLYYTAFYGAQVRFLHMEQDLLQGPSTLGPKQHSWDFSLKIPALSNSWEGSFFRPGSRCYDPATGRARFDDSIGQPLPPSFCMTQYMPFCAFQGLVYYKLKVRLTRAKRVFLVHKNSKTAKMLVVLSIRDIAEPSPQSLSQRQPFDRRSLRLFPDHEEYSLSAREMLQSIVHSSKDFPLARFRLRLSTPRIGVLGQPLPIFLSVEHDVNISTTEAPPLVYLKRVRVVVKTRVNIRVVRYLVFRQRRDRVLRWKRSYKMAQGFSHGAHHTRASPVPVTDQMDLRKLMALDLDPKSLSPDFSTFNVAVHHELTAKVVVECARKRFVIYQALTGLKLLPQVYMAPGPIKPDGEVVQSSTASDTTESGYATSQEEDSA